MSGEFLIAILLVVGVVGILLIVWVMRQPREYRPPNFKMPRLQVLDDARIDKDRRLVLVRRDNVEHLLLIGGASDVVVEQYAVGSESYQQEGELESIKDEKQSIESRQSTSQLQIGEKSGAGSETGYKKEVAGNQTSNSGSELNKNTADKLPSIIGDLVKSTANSPNEGRTSSSASERNSPSGNQAVGDSQNNSENQKVAEVATTDTIGQNESLEKTAQVQKNAATSSTEAQKVQDSSQVKNTYTESVRPKKIMKKADMGEESNNRTGNKMLEKLQQRQSREPIPSNRVPNFLPRGKDAESVESKTENNTANQIGNKTGNLTGMNTIPVDFINEENKTGSEMSQPNQNRDSNLMSGNIKQGQENTKPHSDSGKLYTESDEDVFESIGKEMNKILSELRKDSEGNAQQNQ